MSGKEENLMDTQQKQEYQAEIKNEIDQILQTEESGKIEKLSQLLNTANQFVLRQNREMDFLIYIISCMERGKDSGERNPLEQMSSMAEIVSFCRKTRWILYHIEQGWNPLELGTDFQFMMQNEVPVYFVMLLIKKYIRNQPQVIVRLATGYCEYGEVTRALRMLLYAVQWYPEADEMKIALADLYLQLQRYQDAFQILCKISKPNETIQSLIQTIKRLL